VTVIHEINVDELAGRMAAGARVIDVREEHEYLDGHVPGAVHIALGEVPDRVDEFAGDGTTYVICRSGARSMSACEFAAAHGFDVANVAGGTLAWVASGRDVVVGRA
jgi:rhodanese-related sulfurtransferase